MTTPYGGSASTSSYSTNNLNEYTSVGGTGQSSDANGNLTDNGTYLFAYDYKNHIAQVKLKSTSAVVATYRYDALGRRVEKNVGGTVERHILSIWNEPGVVEDLSHVVCVYDGSDVWRQDFVWSDEVDGIQMLQQKDVLDFDTDGNTTEVTRSFYHRNALGSVMEITDMNQAVVVSYRYDPYGKVTITRLGVPQSSDPLGNHWTFTGRFLDEETGLLYYRARCYDPATGRFTGRDPLGCVVAPNLLDYVGSSPVNLKDPTGTDPLTDMERTLQELESELDASYAMQNAIHFVTDIVNGFHKALSSPVRAPPVYHLAAVAVGAVGDGVVGWLEDMNEEIRKRNRTTLLFINAARKSIRKLRKQSESDKLPAPPPPPSERSFDHWRNPPWWNPWTGSGRRLLPWAQADGVGRETNTK